MYNVNDWKRASQKIEIFSGILSVDREGKIIDFNPEYKTKKNIMLRCNLHYPPLIVCPTSYIS